MMEALMNYVKPELVVLAFVLYFIGVWIKKTELVKDKYIPAVLGLVGIVFSAMYVFATSRFDGASTILMAIFTSVMQGVLCAGLSTYVNQLIKQSKKDE